MRVFICLLILIASSVAQYIAVGEPNPSAPTSSCSKNVFTCPEVPPPPPPPPPPTIPGVFSAIYKYLDDRQCIETQRLLTLRAYSYQDFVPHLQNFNILDKPCPLLAYGRQLIERFLKLVLDQPVGNNVEFSQIIDQSLAQLNNAFGGPKVNPKIKCALQQIYEQANEFKWNLVNNAKSFQQVKSATYAKYITDVKKLHKIAVNSACPKQAQKQFFARFATLFNDITDELEHFLNNACEIGNTFKDRIHELASRISQAEISYTTYILS